MTAAAVSAGVMRARAAPTSGPTARALVVSEDPYFIEEAAAVLAHVGGRVIGCLGPAHTRLFRSVGSTQSNRTLQRWEVRHEDQGAQPAACR